MKDLATRLGASLAKGAALASSRFPVAAVLVVILSIIVNAEIAGASLLPDETLDRWVVSIYTAAAVSVLSRLALEARGNRAGLLAVGPLVAALLASAAVRYAEPLGINAPALVAALTLSIPLVPYLGRPDDRRFWTFTLWMAVGVTLGFLSVLLFVLGLSAILEMIRFLFEVGVSSRIYEHIYATALTLVGPLMALGRIPTDFDETTELSADDRMAQGVRLLVDWVAAPLALATALVLHLYAAKILALGTMPRNEVGWIVTSYAVFVLALRIAAEPFVGDGRFFTKGFAKAWAPMLAVPIGLLAAAVAQRVMGEGWTLERYYLALGGLACCFVLAAQMPRKLRGSIRAIAAIPLVLLVLSSFGPFGVADVVGRSQAARLAALVDGDAKVQPGRGDEARSRIDALSEVGELARVAELLADERRPAFLASLRDDGANARDFAVAAIGAAGGSSAGVEPTRIFVSSQPAAVSVGGFDLALVERWVVGGDGRIPDVDGVAHYLDGSDLVLAIGRTTDRFPLAPVVAAMPSTADETQSSDPGRVLVELVSEAGRVLRLDVRRLAVEEKAGVVQLTATILVRQADWPGSALFGGGAKAGVAEPGGAIGQGPR